VCSVGLYLARPGDVVLVFAVYAATQLFTDLGAPILWTMMADSVDYGEAQTGRRITGLVFAGNLFTMKLGMAVGGAVLGWLLAFYGYDGEAGQQTPRAVAGIVLVFSLVPAVGHGLLMAIVTRYRLTGERCAQIRAQLQRRGRGEETDA
jgi:GPH family glycoside/pentoside/hexuronide:cation symporter